MMLKKIKPKPGFTLIELLIALAILIITLAGGVVVWERKISPRPTPTPTPFSQVLPTPTIGRGWTQSCQTDNDCPKQFCQPPGTPCAQYYCIQGRCQLVEPEAKTCKTDADCPPIACAQGCPAEGPCPPCPKNRCLNGQCQKAYPDYFESLDKKIQLSPGQTVRIKDTNLSITLLQIIPPPKGSFDYPTRAELEVRSGNKREKISFIAGVSANQETAQRLRQKEVFGFKIIREKLTPERMILRVEKL